MNRLLTTAEHAEALQVFALIRDALGVFEGNSAPMLSDLDAVAKIVCVHGLDLSTVPLPSGGTPPRAAPPPDPPPKMFHAEPEPSSPEDELWFQQGPMA